MSKFIFGLFAAMTFAFSASAQTHKGVTFQGVIKNADGTYPTVPGATAVLKVLSPNNCILWEEQHSGVNISDGYINLVVGKGTTGGHQPAGQTFPNVFNNATTQTGLTCLNLDGTINGGLTSYTPTAQDARKLRLETTIPSGPIQADFNLRSMPFAVASENADTAKRVGTKAEADLLAVNGAVGLTQANLEEFIQSLTSVSGGSVRWNGTNFVSYDPSNGANLSTGSVPGTAIASLPWSKLTSVPSPLVDIGGLSCIDGKILKKVAGAWACSDESGVGTEVDPTVEAYAQNPPGSGLMVVANELRADFGTGAGKVVEGNDSRLTDSRSPSGPATGDLGGSYPNPTVNQLRGQPVSATTPTADQVLVYTGGTWTPTTFGIQNLRTSVGASQFSVGSCGAHQTLNWSAITDAFACTNINNLDGDKITAGTIAFARLPTGTTSSTVAVGNDSRFPSSTCGSGNKMRWDGSAWQCEGDANAGGTISSLTGDVTASGSGAVAATVAQVGGVSAANVASGANLANAATDANTASAIVKRDASGNFTAGTITANLTGNVTGNLTGNVTGNLSGNVTGNVSGTSANVTGTVAVANGGTGVTSAPTNGQILIGNGTGYTLATITAGSASPSRTPPAQSPSPLRAAPAACGAATRGTRTTSWSRLALGA